MQILILQAVSCIQMRKTNIRTIPGHKSQTEILITETPFTIVEARESRGKNIQALYTIIMRPVSTERARYIMPHTTMAGHKVEGHRGEFPTTLFALSSVESTMASGTRQVWKKGSELRSTGYLWVKMSEKPL